MRLWRSWKLRRRNPLQKRQCCPHCSQEDWKREKTWFRCSLRFLGNAIGLANMLPRSNPPQTGPNKAEEPHSSSSSSAHLQRLPHSNDFLYSQLKTKNQTYLCCCFSYFLHWYSSNVLLGACFLTANPTCSNSVIRWGLTTLCTCFQTVLRFDILFFLFNHKAHCVDCTADKKQDSDVMTTTFYSKSKT